MTQLNQSIANLSAAKHRYGTILVHDLLIETAFSGIPLPQLCAGLQTTFPELKTDLYRRLLALTPHELDNLIAKALDEITVIDDSTIPLPLTFTEWLTTI